MALDVDLRQLASEPERPPAPALDWRRLVVRFLLPGLLLAGFGVLLVAASWERLYPPREVTVVPVLTLRHDAGTPVDTPVFQAAGWVEPRPTPIVVTALAEGVVERLLVVEGQAVAAGEVVAHLIDADARLALDAAEADVKLREGELAAARAARVAADARLDRPLHLAAELAEAEAALARVETERAGLPKQLAAAEARQEFARYTFEGKQKASALLPEAALARARSELTAADAAVEELRVRQGRLAAEATACRERRDALAERYRLRTDEVRQAGEAAAGVQSAEARLAQARVLRDAARLRLERMEIRAPVAGRVLALVARPGSRLMGQDPRSLHDASTVLTLYDPASLQVRVDVRLEDVARVTVGQKATIETAAVPGGPLAGTVLLPTSQADLGKNTLPVKVAVADPPPTLRPDMLCQATFLAPPRPAGPPGTSPERLLIPRQLVDAGDRVWVADRVSGTARRRTVELGPTFGELVEAKSGLGVTDWLIVAGREGLAEGDRIRVAGEDATLGLAGR